MRNEKGITLATLVISIIVLLILASILVYSGVSTIRYTNYNKAKAEIETLQTNVNSWYDEYIKIEVTEEEISEGQTREQVLANKHQQFLNHYGVLPSDPSCDQTKLNNTIQGVQENGYNIVANNFIFLSSQKINDTLGLNFTFDYLVNIPSRKVILFNGILYNGKRYYTAEDFGILNVEKNPLNGISFQLKQDEGFLKNIIIYNLSFVDTNEKDVNISKFRVFISEKDANKWTEVTNKITETQINNQKAYKVSDLDYKEYDVKISTTDNKVDWQEMVEIVEPRAVFKAGADVNKKMKQLAGNSNVLETTVDTTITAVRRANTIADQYKIPNNIVSTSDSNTPIYMWFDNENATIYYYTDDPNPEANENSKYMFKELKNATTLELETIDTSKVTDMENMFGNCSNLTSLNLVNFETSNVTNMKDMFALCTSLTTIYASQNFVTTKVENSTNMFDQDNSLKGEKGTEYDSSNKDKTYARIDGAPSPGYFSTKPQS